MFPRNGIYEIHTKLLWICRGYVHWQHFIAANSGSKLGEILSPTKGKPTYSHVGVKNCHSNRYSTWTTDEIIEYQQKSNANIFRSAVSALRSPLTNSTIYTRTSCIYNLIICTKKGAYFRAYNMSTKRNDSTKLSRCLTYKTPYVFIKNSHLVFARQTLI